MHAPRAKLLQHPARTSAGATPGLTRLYRSRVSATAVRAQAQQQQVATQAARQQQLGQKVLKVHYVRKDQNYAVRWVGGPPGLHGAAAAAHAGSRRCALARDVSRRGVVLLACHNRVGGCTSGGM